jgi:hypothetical protein
LDKVGRILTVLSAYEESSAECIADMLIHFSKEQYQEGILDAAKFLCHVEALFSGLDAVYSQALKLSAEKNRTLNGSSSYRREPKYLSKRIVHFFCLLSHAKEPSGRKEVPKEMITLVTELANTLKSIIRTALTNAVKLVCGNQSRMSWHNQHYILIRSVSRSS